MFAFISEVFLNALTSWKIFCRVTSVEKVTFIIFSTLKKIVQITSYNKDIRKTNSIHLNVS